MQLRRSWCLLLLALAPTLLVHGQQKGKPTWAPSPHVAATDPLRPEEQVKKFHLPPGFEMQLVAADPDIRKPINIAFDAAGRLWVTETIEYPFPAAEGKGRDAVKILENFGPDGKASKITTFADGLNIPIGVLPITPKEALVYSIPSIWKMTDTDGDGKADKREVLYDRYGYKDTHGMTGEFQMGFDGWVYACHGFANTSKVKGKGDESIQMQSGNTYRFKPDGSNIEYFTHGQVNPFGLCFDPLGNLYSADCHTRPLYQLLRGAWYPSFGAPHDGLGFGPEMVTHDHGSTAIAGVAYYAADQYPEEFRDNLFVGNVVTNRINRDRLERHGSTYKGKEMPDFVKCDDPWFRPVDIKLGPDGCLYVADFYNRIIGHYEVPLNHPGRDRDKGRIWRIVYRGKDGKGGPRPVEDLTKANPAALSRCLDDANLTVRMQATEQLVRIRGKEVEDIMHETRTTGSPRAQAHALWVLHRLERLNPSQLAAAYKSQDALLRTHVQRILSAKHGLPVTLRRLAVIGLGDKDAFVQRAAAEALGAHPMADNVMPLIQLRQNVPADDTHLLHAVRMALRDQLRQEEIWSNIDLAQFDEKAKRALADVCPGVHNANASSFLFTVLRDYDFNRDEQQRYLHAAVRYGDKDAPRTAMTLVVDRFRNDAGTQAALLKTVNQACQERGITLGDAERKIAESLVTELFRSPNPQVAVELAGTFKLTSAQQDLLGLAWDKKAPEALRKSAIATVVAIEPKNCLDAMEGFLHDEKGPIALREQAASSLAATNSKEAHAILIKALESTPSRIQTTIALGMAGSPQGGERLLMAVGVGKASPRLLQDRGIELKLRQAKIADLDKRLANLTKGLPAADQRVQELLTKKRESFVTAKGDEAAGAKVFQKHCAACHQIANQGAKIGPQLDGIGIRGLDRILEDVLDPNRNVDQAFRATTIETEGGQFITGLVLREEGQVIVIADAQGKEQRVPKGNVANRTVSQLSPMPSNFAEQITAGEFNDLLAYLLSRRAKE